MPNTIYVNQTKITLSLETGIDLTGASAVKILYQKPKGDKGVLNATANGTKMVYDAVPGDFNEVGVWQLQPWAVIGGLDAYGAITHLNVINNLK